jgi:hypothetical protein
MGNLSKVNLLVISLFIIELIFLFSYTVSSNGLTYSVGICVPQDSSNASIIQKETNVSIVLGRLNQVNLVGEG